MRTHDCRSACICTVTVLPQSGQIFSSYAAIRLPAPSHISADQGSLCNLSTRPWAAGEQAHAMDTGTAASTHLSVCTARTQPVVWLLKPPHGLPDLRGRKVSLSEASSRHIDSYYRPEGTVEDTCRQACIFQGMYHERTCNEGD